MGLTRKTPGKGPVKTSVSVGPLPSAKGTVPFSLTRKSGQSPGKRQAILDQAIRTFAELGFRGTDVQVIADGAGVGKGTVYRYFRSKQDLFWATTYEVLAADGAAHVRRLWKGSRNAQAKLRAAAVAYAQFFLANPEVPSAIPSGPRRVPRFRPGVAPRASRENDRRMGEILQQGIDAGRLRPVDPRRPRSGWAACCSGDGFGQPSQIGPGGGNDRVCG